MKRILKWAVPVDDAVHEIGAGDVLHVDCQFGPGVVQVWTMETDETFNATRRVQVVATGQPLHDAVEHIGSAVFGSDLVWHVLDLGPAS